MKRLPLLALLALTGCFGHRLNPTPGAPLPARREKALDMILSVEVVEREKMFLPRFFLRERLVKALQDSNLFREVRLGKGDDDEAFLRVTAAWDHSKDKWDIVKKTFYFLPISYNHEYRLTYTVDVILPGGRKNYDGVHAQKFSFRTFSWWRSGKARRTAAEHTAAKIAAIISADLDALAAPPQRPALPSAKPLVPTKANDDQLE